MRAPGQVLRRWLLCRLEAGWQKAYGNHRITPFASIDVATRRTDGFTEESDGILGLAFGSSSATSPVSSLGVQFDTRILLAKGQLLTPFTRVAWAHEFNPDRGADSNLILSPAAAFATEGVFAASEVAKIDAGL